MLTRISSRQFYEVRKPDNYGRFVVWTWVDSTMSEGPHFDTLEAAKLHCQRHELRHEKRLLHWNHWRIEGEDCWEGRG